MRDKKINDIVESVQLAIFIIAGTFTLYGTAMGVIACLAVR